MTRPQDNLERPRVRPKLWLMTTNEACGFGCAMHALRGLLLVGSSKATKRHLLFRVAAPDCRPFALVARWPELCIMISADTYMYVYPSCQPTSIARDTSPRALVDRLHSDQYATYRRYYYTASIVANPSVGRIGPCKKKEWISQGKVLSAMVASGVDVIFQPTKVPLPLGQYLGTPVPAAAP